MKTQIISVNFKDKSYPIYMGSQLLAEENLMRQHLKGKQVMVVSNETVAALYLPLLRKSLADLQCDEMLLPDGEQYKNFAQVQRLWDALINHHHHRDTTLIALGGGVIGDITGFAAACYQRGVNFLQIPTTLLAQVDASIGGKTAINHPLGKNLIGAFHQPQAVIIDINTLKTLPKRQYHAGLAEIIKVALINDCHFFTWLETHLAALLQQQEDAVITAIKRACEIKRDIVIADEKETADIRALLNLGHTFAHAIENTIGYGEWLHGEAVAVGLILAAKLSHQQGWLPIADLNRITQLLQRVPLPVALPSTMVIDNFLSAMQMDKKVLASKLRLILLKDIGKAFVTDQVTVNEIKSIL